MYAFTIKLQIKTHKMYVSASYTLFPFSVLLNTVNTDNELADYVLMNTLCICGPRAFSGE